MQRKSFSALLKEIRACDACAFHLRVPPKPVVQLHPDARVLLIAQAPGMRARTSGKPFDDASGDRLRSWLLVDRATFYDEKKFACMPMGFCYPGTNEGGDLPPCKDCAPLWHPQILPELKNIKLTLLIGSYAHRHYLQTSSVHQAVINYRNYLPSVLPLPHPSWHNNNWLAKNPWFMDELVPELRARIKRHLRE
jgi:uracil-DNA glycosylase